MTDKQLMVPNLEEVKALELVSRMDVLLEQAEDWDSLLNVRNGAMGMAVTAAALRMAEVAQRAKIVELKAERKAGGWVAGMPKNEGGNSAWLARSPGTQPPTLSEISESVGVSRSTLIDWQRMSKVPDRLFHRWLDDMLKDGEEVSQRGFLRFIKPEGPAKEPEKPLTLLDRIVKAISEASEVLHAIGTTDNPGQYKRALAWAKQAEASIAELHRGATKLVRDLEKDVEGMK